MKQNELNLFETPQNAPNDVLHGLNTEQKAAVIHQSGPLLIIAGAGTGKTTVITRRIAYIIGQHWAEPSQILALTFTEKAASEMETRVDLLTPYGYTDMWIFTFHAFGDRLIRDHALDLGLPANFKVLTRTEQAIFMRQNLYSFDLKYFRPIASPTTHIQALLTHFSRLKDELISPEAYIAWAECQMSNVKCQNDKDNDCIEAEKTLELANAYNRYQELMIQAGNLDFGDQIYLVYNLLKNHPKVLAEIQQKFKYILVDEYQDTNYAQNEIVKLIAGKSGNITVVGDDDQSIYRFRGASISNILQFKHDYNDIKQIVLNQNYRSSQEILSAAYKLIQHNNPDRLEVQNHIDKKLISNKHGSNPELLHCDSLSCEADVLVKKIVELKKLKNLSFKDFAILVRANSQSEPFIQALNMSGIPYIFSGSANLLQRPEIKALVSFLRCLVCPDDNLSFYHLATSDIYNVPPSELARDYILAKRKNLNFADIIKKNVVDTPSIEVVHDIDKYQAELGKLKAGELLYQFLKDKNVLKNMMEKISIENEIKIQNIAKFFDRISQFDRGSDDNSVLAFLNSLELTIEMGDDIQSAEIDPDIDAVNILTAHSAKGLEYPVVFVVNMVSDRFPSRQKREMLPIPDELIREKLPQGNFHLQEERRLFFVACTRAKDYLFLTSADDYGGKRAKKLSQFVLELLDNPSANRVKKTMSPMEKIERFQNIKILNPKQPDKKTPEESILKLSRQQIDDYFTCPQKYYFAHIVKIPLLENHYLMYGTAIHAALDHYFNRRIRKETATLESLLSDYQQAFRNVGFITREHEKLRFSQGTETLKKFYEKDQAINKIPTGVEIPFEFNKNNIKIRGRYDLIYNNSDHSEICDFKTSDVRTQKDADRRIKESTQMQIYALAWKEKHGSIPKTTLYFIESGLKGERAFGSEELNSTKLMIFDVADGIKARDYTAKPDKFSCAYCPYRDICPKSLV